MINDKNNIRVKVDLLLITKKKTANFIQQLAVLLQVQFCRYGVS